ncbi:MAG: hypothetical protein ACK8QZ_10545 [Anaerolineales bacterium]
MEEAADIADKRLKVFISWSGKLSEQVALVVRDLLAEVFDNVKPFMSQTDIALGTRGLNTIARELENSIFWNRNSDER